MYRGDLVGRDGEPVDADPLEGPALSVQCRFEDIGPQQAQMARGRSVAQRSTGTDCKHSRHSEAMNGQSAVAYRVHVGVYFV